jgi:hypothetical protein
VEFHVHTYASLLAIKVMLSQNFIGKSDQLMVYVFKLLNRTKQNYSTTQRKALAMIFALHKFKHYFLGNKFVFYVRLMALVYLVNKPHVSRKIVKWLLFFLKYGFTIVYMPCKTHVLIDALSRLPDITEPTCVFDQTLKMQVYFTHSLNG